VIYRPSSSIRTKALIGCLSLLAFVCAPAQASQDSAASLAAPLVQSVPLVSGACPAVRRGGVISLDWNPGFDPSYPVTGLKFTRLVFHQLREDGASINPSSRLVLESDSRGLITAIGNGYFHIEARLPLMVHPGTYHLVGAVGSPQLLSDYQGEAPKMTVSPVRESFCITVVPALRASSSPSGGN
jgi:hypothetical protein